MTKHTRDILKGISYESKGTIPETISSIVSNSKNVVPGSLFFAIIGFQEDGHRFAKKAIENGSICLVVEKFLPGISAPQIKVNNTRIVLSRAASNFYNHPSDKLKVIGITGTNGKTTVTYLMNNILKTAGISRGTIGTLGYSIKDENFPTVLTTPDCLILQKILSDMVEKYVSHVIMEVSSHALSMNRIEGISFRSSVFTNISQDHLDFHLTMDNYVRAKTLLFKKTLSNGFTICNIDDNYADNFLSISKAQTYTYSIKKDADFTWAPGVRFKSGIIGTVNHQDGQIRVQCPLSGEFNLYNILAAIATAIRIGIEPCLITEALSNTNYIPGRLQEISFPNKLRVFVDYAHTPGAILSALKVLKDLVPQNGKIITVFGCGGNRDRKKRKLMAQAVEKFSDFAVVTNDNPRFEDPEKIIGEIIPGFTKKMRYTVIENRKEAIIYAIEKASSNYIVAILGKGHEDYQEIKGIRYPFNDIQIIKEYLDDSKN